jgi:hypothetical protein
LFDSSARSSWQGRLGSDPILGQFKRLYGLADDLLGECGARTAPGRHSKATAKLCEVAGAGAHSVADLLLGHAIAQTDEHDQASWMEM